MAMIALPIVEVCSVNPFACPSCPSSPSSPTSVFPMARRMSMRRADSCTDRGWRYVPTRTRIQRAKSSSSMIDHE